MAGRPASKIQKVPESERGAVLPADSRARRTGRVALAAALVLLALWVAQGFLVPLAWAVVIALTVWPMYRQFLARLSARRSRVLAPLAFTIGVGLVLFVPVALALHQAAQESQAVGEWLAHARQHGIAVPSWLSAMPLGDYGVRWWQANLSDPKAVTEWLGAQPDKGSDAALTRAWGAEFLHRLFLFFVALVTVFVLLRDGAWIGSRVLDTADRLLGDPGERLASKMVETVRGTVMGTVIVALVEGAIIGVVYVLAGVPNPLLFALLTMAFAMVPFGAWVMFTSAAVLLVLQGGSMLAAAMVFVSGAAVMLIGDVFVWPALVGNQARLPFLLALIGIFGGLHVFGLIGLFIGPMILAAAWIVWREWLVSPDGSRAASG